MSRINSKKKILRRKGTSGSQMKIITVYKETNEIIKKIKRVVTSG